MMKFPDFKQSDATKLRTGCNRCGRPTASGVTGWLFGSAGCKCEDSYSNDSADDADTAGREHGIEFPDLGSHWLVLGFLGEGGMGRIFKAQSPDGTICAVKVLKGELSEDREALKRFEQEVDAVSTLDHPNLVSVLSRGITVDGAPYLVMDYVDGGNLAGYLKKGPIKENEIVDIVSDLTAALRCAHAGGVIHRDIKPSNVLLTGSGDRQRAKLVDFGIAKLMPTESTGLRETHDLTKTGDIFGTPNYMSPEQCMGFKLDERSDVYSLGCLIYELMSGKPPFGGENPIQIVVKQISDEPPSLTGAKDSDLARGLEAIVFKCLRKKPEERFQSMADVDAHLEKLRRGEKIRLQHKVAEPKAHLSRSQISYLFGLGVWSLIYGLMYLELGGTVILPFSIIASGSLVAELIRSRKKMFLRQPERKQWRTLRKIIFVVFTLFACITFAAGFGLMEWIPPEFQYLLVPLVIFQVFLFITFVATVIGEFWFGKEHRVPISSTGKKLILISIPMMIVGYLLLPTVMDKTARVLVSGPRDQSHENPVHCRAPRWAKTLCQTLIFWDKSILSAYKTQAELLLQLKSPQAAVDLLDRGIKFGTKETPLEVSLLHARALSAAGKTSAALREVDKTLKDVEDWNKDEVLLTRSRIQFEHNDLSATIAYIDDAIEHTDADARADNLYLLRAAAHWRSGERDKALADVTKCISRRLPSTPMASLGVKRAVLYELSNNRKAAENDLRKALTEWEYSDNVFANLSIWTECLVNKDDAAQKFLIKSYVNKKLGQQSQSDLYLHAAELLGGTQDDLLGSFARDFDIKISW
ncbi:MAG: protein kinase [Candidatus Obscuribacterales bacterium]|nr:protein kinase [Candidatus Obscuribacterales bacterium]